MFNLKKVLFLWLLVMVVLVVFMLAVIPFVRWVSGARPGRYEARVEKLLAEDKVDEAIRLLSRTIRHYPEEADAHFLIGMTLKQKSMEYFDRALQSNSAFAQARFERGLAGVKDGQWPEGVRDLRYALLFDTGAGVSLSQWEEAAQLVAGADVQGDTLYTTVLLAGEIFQKLGMHDRVLIEFEKAAEMSPNDPQAHWLLGQQYEQSGYWKKAAEKYERVLQIVPHHLETLKRLASLYRRQEMHAPAESLAEQVRALSPSHFSYGCSLENYVYFLGYDISSDVLRPGDTFQIDFYWQCIFPVEQDYIVGVEFYDGNRERANVNLTHWHEPTREGTLYPTSKWQVGEVVKDTQRITVPPQCPTGRHFIVMHMVSRDTNETMAPLPLEVPRWRRRQGKFLAGVIDISK